MSSNNSIPQTSEAAHRQLPEDTESDSDDGWQIKKANKRSKQGYPKSVITTTKRQHLEDFNQFAVLATEDVNEKMQLDSGQETEQISDTNKSNGRSINSNEPKPPPVFIPGVTNIAKLLECLLRNGVNTNDEITYKTLRNNEIKLMTNSTSCYRKVINFLSKDNAEFHTYQLKQDRAYRIVIRNIHPSTSVDDIKLAIEEMGYKVRNIINIRHRATKNPLPLHFVDLEPSENNKDIYNVQFLLNARIRVEAPRSNTEIVQCHRCQLYGHTKSYCNRPFRCVKCGKDHDTATCTKSKDSTATCTLCGGNHPANYKGCVVYKEIQRRKNIPIRTQQFSNRLSTNEVNITQNTTQLSSSQPQPPLTATHPVQTATSNNPLYSDILQGTRRDACNATQYDSEPIKSILSSFHKLEEILKRQAEQTMTLINLLTTVISKLA